MIIPHLTFSFYCSFVSWETRLSSDERINRFLRLIFIHTLSENYREILIKVLWDMIELHEYECGIFPC